MSNNQYAVITGSGFRDFGMVVEYAIFRPNVYMSLNKTPYLFNDNFVQRQLVSATVKELVNI